jgi:hypothetical protein
MPLQSFNFPVPPSHSAIRIVEESGLVTLTNLPSADEPSDPVMSLDQDPPLRTRNSANFVRAGSCLSNAGWLFLIIGVLFIGAAAIATLVFDVPFKVNGKAADKFTGGLFLGGFLIIWILFCVMWNYAARYALAKFGRLNQLWRLILGPQEWVCFRAETNQVIGKCDPSEIDQLSVNSEGVVIAERITGTSVALTGPLPAFDANWLCTALAQHLGRPDIQKVTESHSMVPEPSSHLTAGQVLRWRLPRGDTPWTAVFAALAVGLFWNGITSVFVYQAFFGEKQFNWTLGLFMIPFVAVGIGMVVFFITALWNAIVQSRIGTTTVELHEHPLIPGHSCRALVLQAGPLHLRRLSIRLVCEEQATFREGTSTRTETKQVRVIELFEEFDLQIPTSMPGESHFDLQLPTDVMHSFDGTHNEIVWKLIVKGEPENWPHYVREYPVVIAPIPRRRNE